MRYWDASALLPLVYPETASAPLLGLYQADPAVLTWTLSRLELAALLQRKEREGVLRQTLQRARSRLAQLSPTWAEVGDAQPLRQRAEDLLEAHPLTAADALQLAAALTAAEDKPRDLPFVTLNPALAQAARMEGFAVSPSLPSRPGPEAPPGDRRPG